MDPNVYDWLMNNKEAMIQDSVVEKWGDKQIENLQSGLGKMGKTSSKWSIASIQLTHLQSDLWNLGKICSGIGTIYILLALMGLSGVSDVLFAISFPITIIWAVKIILHRLFNLFSIIMR